MRRLAYPPYPGMMLMALLIIGPYVGLTLEYFGKVVGPVTVAYKIKDGIAKVKEHNAAKRSESIKGKTMEQIKSFDGERRQKLLRSGAAYIAMFFALFVALPLCFAFMFALYWIEKTFGKVVFWALVIAGFVSMKVFIPQP